MLISRSLTKLQRKGNSVIGARKSDKKPLEAIFPGVVIAVLLLHVVFIVFYGMQKSGFHEDEYYSYFSSAGYESIDPYGAIQEKSGYEVQRQFLVTPEHRFEFKKVVHNQELDVHPPLYYLSLNFVMSVFTGRFSKWFGIGLNTVYSLVSCCGILFFFYYLDRSKYRYILSTMAGLSYAICPAMISNAMFTRMYAMSAMWTILYADIFLVLMKNRNSDKRIFAGITVCGGAVCYLSFLTHYFCLITAFFLTVGYCVFELVKRKNIVRMLCYGMVQVISIGLAVRTFPVSIEHIFNGYRGTGALNGLIMGDFITLLKLFLPIIDKNFFGNLMYPIFILTGAAILVGVNRVCKRRKEGRAVVSDENVIVAIVLCSIGITLLVLCKTALVVGDVASRFFYPVGALMIPMFSYCIYKAGLCVFEARNKESHRTWWKFGLLCTIMLLVSLSPAITGLAKGNVIFLYADKKAKVTFSKENAQSPAIVVYNSDAQYRSRSWFIANELWPYENVVYVDYQDGMYSLDSDILRNADKLVVYMDCPEEFLKDLIAVNVKLNQYSLERHDQFFYVYVVE